MTNQAVKKIPVILDGDPGHDDAIAWVLATASPQLDIKAVTSVWFSDEDAKQVVSTRDGTLTRN